MVSWPPISKMVSNRLLEHLVAYEAGPRLVGRDLILYGVRPHELPYELAPRARGAHPQNPHPAAQLTLYLLEARVHHLYGPSPGAEVDLLHHLSLLIGEDEVRAHRAHVDPQVGAQGLLPRGELIGACPLPEEQDISHLQGLIRGKFFSSSLLL